MGQPAVSVAVPVQSQPAGQPVLAESSAMAFRSLRRDRSPMPPGAHRHELRSPRHAGAAPSSKRLGHVAGLSRISRRRSALSGHRLSWLLVSRAKPVARRRGCWLCHVSWGADEVTSPGRRIDLRHPSLHPRWVDRLIDALRGEARQWLRRRYEWCGRRPRSLTRDRGHSSARSRLDRICARCLGNARPRG